MQLLAAHQILIASAIALGGLFGVRALIHFARGGATLDLVLGLLSFAVTGALVMYFRQLRAKSEEQQKR